MCTYSVHIKWAAEEEEEKTGLIDQTAPTLWREHKVNMGKTKVQWQYKVKQGDANFKMRTDTAGDWMDFDEDDSQKIEMHYQKCLENLSFQDSLFLQGKTNGQPNRYIYEISGQNSNPSSWKEVNTSLQFCQPRELNRNENELPTHHAAIMIDYAPAVIPALSMKQLII